MGGKPSSYERLKAEVQRLRREGRIEERPNEKERADWAYGTTKIENRAVTREMAEKAAKAAGRER